MKELHLEMSSSNTRTYNNQVAYLCCLHTSSDEYGARIQKEINTSKSAMVRTYLSYMGQIVGRSLDMCRSICVLVPGVEFRL